MTKRDGDQNIIKAAMNAPYLERKHEQDLAIRWREQRDQQALHQITLAHMRLVISMASKFRNFGLPIADLIQEGHVGLLEAAARFDPDREVRFSTYATWWIRASIQDYVLRNWSIVRGGTSSAQKSLFFNLRRLRAKIAKTGQTRSSGEIYAEISTALGVSEADVALMDTRLAAPDSSLNAPAGSEENTTAERMDFLVCDEPLPDETTSAIIDRERRDSWLNRALGTLNERELRIIRERRLTEDGTTLEALGKTLGISKERVRQIENRALQKLKSSLVQDNPEMVQFAF
ncbi:MAG: RNA polymerase factor sigma-32 [Rhizobiaceae bacterium]